jgi:TonB family protein
MSVSVFICALTLSFGAGGVPAADTPAQRQPTDKEILDNPIDRPPLRYPQAAYEADVEGSVVVEVVLAPDGTVRSVTVLKVDPPGWGFEEAAVEGVKRWRFQPSGREVKFKTIVDFKIPPDLSVPLPL